MARFALLLVILGQLFQGVAHAGAYSGLVIERIWAKDGQVIVKFNCSLSNQFSCSVCPSAFSIAADYRGIMAVLLSAQAQGRTVTLHENGGGMPLQSLVDSSVPDVWAIQISLISID